MLQIRKLKHREIKSLAQSCHIWESQDLNTSSRSHALTHHTHSIPWCKCPWRGSLSGLVPGLLVLAFPEMCLVFPGPWAIVPTPDLEICSHSQLQFFHSMGPLSSADSPCGSHGRVWRPWMLCAICRDQDLPVADVLDAHLHQWWTIAPAPYWACSQTHS